VILAVIMVAFPWWYTPQPVAFMLDAVGPPQVPGYAQSGDDRLVMTGSSRLPETLDPALLRDAESSFIARQVFRGLVKLDNDLIARPDLASAIDVSGDGLTYTFQLKENAVFHDGTPIDAQAVADSLNRAADPELAGGDGFALPAAIYLNDIEGAEDRLAGAASTISGIDVLDGQALQIRLSRPSASFLYQLTGNPASVVDVSETDNEGWWREPNGSGPFEMEVMDESEIVLDGFDDFYDGAPALGGASILFGSRAAQPLNLYEREVVDIAEVPFYAIERVSSPSDPLNADLVVQPQLSTTYVAMNPNVEPFDDPAVRRAVAQALDREKIVRVMFADAVTRADGLVPAGILDREWPSQPLPYDLDAAQTAASMAEPSVAPPAFYGGINVTIQQILERDLGIEAQAIGLDWSEFSSRLQDQSLPAFSLTWIADFPDPAIFLDALFHSRSPDNYIGYSNPDVDRLLDDAAVEHDPEVRANLYLQAQQMIIDDAVLVPLYHDVSYTLVNQRVSGLTITPIGILSLEDVQLR
ncbi:MAG: peptide ABC transporter substrate-binding protein, partial [Chloroflexota bacterium]|nr:peptide ABC transporter substrate-binding protein [Chloroflexota bacterium]